MTYDIEMTPAIKSRAKFLKFIPTNTIVSGQRFDISFRFKNIGNGTSPALTIGWNIIWPSNQIVNDLIEVPSLTRETEFSSEPYPTHALCEGFGLINLMGVPIGFRLRVGGKWYDSANFAQDSIGHVNAKRPQEVYALWGLVVSAFGLFIVALDKIVTFIRWLVPNL